jgi:hypothetical protein
MVNVPSDRMRKGGPLVVSFRLMPLFAMLWECLAQRLVLLRKSCAESWGLPREPRSVGVL